MLSWLKQYRRELLAGDLTAGIIVVLMMVPQGMAYALVAGWPGCMPVCYRPAPTPCLAAAWCNRWDRWRSLR